MVLVKICGITNLTDALAAAAAGADMLGFNFYHGSARFITASAARRIIDHLPPRILSVGVFVNEESPEAVVRLAALAGVGAVQLHGDESPAYCRAVSHRMVIKALRVGSDFKPAKAAEYHTEAILLDAYSGAARGGTGETCDWTLARSTCEITSKLFLAGGLTPDNVEEAIRAVRPFAVDACSGIESAPGLKDAMRLRAFVAAVRRAAREKP